MSINELPDPAALDVSGDAETHASPGLRPEVLGDASQRQTKAMVHAALFNGTGGAPTIGPYQVLKLLGEGGMGVVYAAYDDKLERKVALKLIRGAAMRRPEGRSPRTLREARALARVSHPNVVHVYQVGEVDDEIYVAMEFLTGPTLRTWLGATPRTWREVLAVFRQAGDGLAAAHRQGVIHRDFKPANVIVGDDGRVRVLDFGLAHFFGLDGDAGELKALPPAGEVTDVLLTQTGAVLGTPAYMAAEQFAGGRGDAKTDQFSFCTALYEALHGQRPFAGDRLDALASAVLEGRVQPVKPSRDVPAWLQRVVMRGLQPDPAARWPSMDALLVALRPPEARRWGRGVAVTGSALALLVGGMGYALMRDPPADPAVAAGLAEQEARHAEAAARSRAQLLRTQDEKVLVEARAALARDPVETVRALAKLAGDDPATWHDARFFSAAAAARGLPDQVLRAGDRPLIEVRPLAGGGFVGRDDLGAVWRWKLSEGTGTRVLPAGAVTQVLVARDVPVWAAMNGRSIEVFGDRAQKIDLDAEGVRASDWQLASDGRTLTATSWTRANVLGFGTVYLWDLAQPGSQPRTIALPPGTFAIIADDASVVVSRAAKGLRVTRPHGGAETTLKYTGTPWMLSADHRFVIAWPADVDHENDVMDVVEIATGKTRRVEAESATVLAGADVLFMQTTYTRPQYRRESLATGEVAWRQMVPAQSGSQDRLVVDPVHQQYAVALGEDWGIGDLASGDLTSFVTVPKDRRPQWAGPGALMVSTHNEVRIHRPANSPVQMRHEGSSCGLAPGGRWAVVQPWDVVHGAYTRVDLTSRAKTTFRCPTTPQPVDMDGDFKMHVVTSTIDGAGQVALFSPDGWSCWWDAEHGARAGTRMLKGGRLVALPRGVAMAEGAEVELWAGPGQRTQRWTAAGTVMDLTASPSGALLAVRSDRGVQVLRVDTGEVVPVTTNATPANPREVFAGSLEWSPDGTRLATLDQAEEGLALRVWDVAGTPREVWRHDLEDSPGRPRNWVRFTPSGTAVALTDHLKSVMLLQLGSGATQQLAIPDLHNLHMRSETDAIGIDFDGLPVLIDFAAAEVAPLTPNPEIGLSTSPQMQRGADGSLWTCASLGPGALVEISAMDATPLPDMPARIRELAASL